MHTRTKSIGQRKKGGSNVMLSRRVAKTAAEICASLNDSDTGTTIDYRRGDGRAYFLVACPRTVEKLEVPNLACTKDGFRRYFRPHR